MKIYVSANAEHDTRRAKKLAFALVRERHIMTHRWWNFSSSFKPDRQAANAIFDVAGADVLVVIMEDERDYSEVWVEVGAALALNKTVVFLGTAKEDMFFRRHPNCLTVHTQQRLFEILKTLSIS